LAAAFSRDGKRIITGNNDGTARLWRVLPTGQALIEYAGQVLPRELTEGQRRLFFLDEVAPK
jgi:WD40 repeat protein